MKKLVAHGAATAIVAASVSFAGSAQAQYATEFVPAKVVKQGTTTKGVAGTGQVDVQVLVNADGTHKVIRVIRSTNPGDNDAALEIAQTSTYAPAHRGKTPQTAYYDYTLKFTGKTLAGIDQDSSSAQIERMIRAGNYSGAQAQATTALGATPTDQHVRQLLAVAQYYQNDMESAATNFAQVSQIEKSFQAIAAQAFANASVKVSTTDPAQALTYAQRAVSLDGSTNSKFALGVAQLANKQTSDAIATLKSVHTTLTADPKTAVGVKVGVDSRLLQAYLDAGDTQDAQAIVDEMKQVDPTNTAGARVLGNHYLQVGTAAAKAKQPDAALKAYDQAAALGDPDVAVTAYTQSALAIANTEKPDWDKAKTYADKAIGIKPDDPAANFVEGIALYGQYATTQKADLKSQALERLKKADDLAKAAGNTSLALQIEGFMKENIK